MPRGDWTGVDHASGDTAQRGQAPCAPFKVGHGSGVDFDHEAVDAGDMVGFHDLRRRIDKIVEWPVVSGGIGQSHERGNRVAEGFRIDGGGKSR
jgi:hypothetical protein